MLRLGAKQRVQSIMLLLMLTVVAYASVTGPEPGYTNAPGDLGNCTQCHDHHAANTGTGSVKITGLPSPYEPGHVYTLSVTTAQSGRIRYGFQLTALDTTNKRAGTLASRDGNTQVLSQTGPGGRQYIEHTQQGSLSSITGSRTWQINWTAPATDIGTVRFFFAGNATNNSGVQDDDDFIYTNSASSDSPTSLVTLSLETDLDDQTLAAGTVKKIEWDTTGPSNIDNIELRYSTDNGATFPISNLIFSTTDATVKSVDWTVPNVSTTHAVLRVRVGKKSGDSVEVLTDEFTIQGDGAPVVPRPVIFSASVDGKKLFVAGDNFEDGAKVELNGEKQKTSNEEDFSHMLKCKKSGKKIERGVPVTLVVKNPDGTRSEPFEYIRPLE
ncbi:MAG: choice-of-anchor V domain-containing protein [Blastocatellia bacterium]